jgi:hypothetical protein
VGPAPGAKDWAGLRAATESPARAPGLEQAGGHPGLAHVGAGAGHQDDDGRAGPGHDPGRDGEVTEANASRRRAMWSVGVGGRDGDAQAGRSRRHRGGPDGGHPDAVDGAREEAVTARSSLPRMTGMMGLGWPGATDSTWAARRARRVALG